MEQGKLGKGSSQGNEAALGKRLMNLSEALLKKKIGSDALNKWDFERS